MARARRWTNTADRLRLDHQQRCWRFPENYGGGVLVPFPVSQPLCVARHRAQRALVAAMMAARPDELSRRFCFGAAAFVTEEPRKRAQRARWEAAIRARAAALMMRRPRPPARRPLASVGCPSTSASRLSSASICSRMAIASRSCWTVMFDNRLFITATSSEVCPKRQATFCVSTASETVRRAGFTAFGEPAMLARVAAATGGCGWL